MIPRYSREKISKIWSDENKYRIWFEIEAHACDAMVKLGIMPEESAKNIWQKGKFSIERILEIEKTTKHDVIAFLTNLAENIGPDARYIHQGMTSSDILDTCLSVQLKQSCYIIINELENLLTVLSKRAKEYKYTPCMGRSHAIHAEPTTFGLKLAGFYAEFKRNLQRLKSAKKEISVCAISGAVGTFANVNPFIQEYVAEKLGLANETISTQIIPRDRHAMLFAVFGVIASSIERLATEIRHLQRTELSEAEEFFSIGQKGSSAMPHKRNPVLSENLTGLARIIRGYVVPALENVVLWHERDISHSSVERIAAPDVTTLLDFSIARLTNIIQNLVIYPNKMQKNLDQLNGLIYSQRVLLLLTQKGLSREESYSIVQKYAMESWNNNLNFLELILKNERIKEICNEQEIKELFDIKYHLKHVDYIFEKVFKE